jgi:hypothetical protein
MAVQRWTLYDPVDDETLTFDYNPNEGGTPGRKKNLTFTSTAAPGGRTLIFEGQDEVLALEFSGVILTQGQLDAFTEWFDKRHQLLLTDDLNRQFWVYMDEFGPDRVRSATVRWKHTYRIHCIVLDVPA